ncbi:MAG: winged helix-turn-helix transcriptional regulator [Solirubrobacterales bacterium]
MNQCESGYNCPVEVTLELIGGKWKPVILWHLAQQTMRFNELRRLLPRVTQKMLTQQLRDLERDGLIVRTVYTQVPPKVEYSLSELGQSFSPILQAMCQWGDAYLYKHTQQNHSKAGESE